MPEFITEYWVLWVFGLLTGGLGFLVRRWIKLEIKTAIQDRKEQNELMRKEIIDKLETEIKVEVEKSNAADVETKANIEVIESNLENLTIGVLAVQGKAFRAGCKELLEPGHIITLEEYEQCVEDHEAYHALGGNHRGDALFASVMTKWEGQLNKDN